MTSRGRIGLFLVLFASVAVTAITVGCNHETLSGGSQDLLVTITPNPAVTPSATGPGRYERSLFTINKIQVLPVDPDLAALFGTQRLLLRYFPYTVSLNATQDATFSTVALSAGVYRVTFLEVTPAQLIDEDVLSNPATCIEGLSVIDGSEPAGIPERFTFVDPPGLIFTIQPGQTKLAIKLNIPGFISGYESSYTCQLGCGFGGTPCLTAFSEAAYRASVVANLTFE